MLGRSRTARVDEWMLRRLHQNIGGPPIRLVLKNRAALTSDTPTVADVIISDRRTLGTLLFNPEIGFGEAYTTGRIQVDGDLAAMLETVYASMSRGNLDNWYYKLASRWLEKIQANTSRTSRKNIRYHYDLSATFFKLWLDAQMVYTCAYFTHPAATLEEAQVAKMEHVCRKLRLQPGETVVEAGAGWGALALHMAKYYGVKVRAFSISHEQTMYARQRAEEEGLSQQVEFIEDDYRNIASRYDVFVSVGMLEHVGPEHFTLLGGVIHRCLGKSGRGLLHFLGRNYPFPLSAWTRKRIFPGTYAPTLGQVMNIFEPWDFTVTDVENLRLHYARTLEHWLERFENSAAGISEMYGPDFVRSWRLFMNGSLAGFRAGTLELFQVSFVPSASQRLPWTRAHLYAEEQNAIAVLK
jgi:cyclopropane-fatty-acyl-phospholipid synthase